MCFWLAVFSVGAIECVVARIRGVDMSPVRQNFIRGGFFIVGIFCDESHYYHQPTVLMFIFFSLSLSRLCWQPSCFVAFFSWLVFSAVSVAFVVAVPFASVNDIVQGAVLEVLLGFRYVCMVFTTFRMNATMV
jgi:hypothetical protein